MKARARRKSSLPYVVRVVRGHVRLFLAAVAGAVVLAALPGQWRVAARLLVAWDVTVALYIGAVFALMARSRVGDIRQRAAISDEGRVGILILTVGSALASLGAIIIELGSSVPGGGGREAANLLLATATILLSWAFTHTIFALHYAHEFYSENAGGGLTFPGTAEPDYWDFVYFSFVVGMTSQVSDVAVSCQPIRRTVAAHGIISFIFNAALLALTVNIAASAI